MAWTDILSLGLLLAGQLAVQSECSNAEGNLLSWLRANGGFVSRLTHSSSNYECACRTLNDFSISSASHISCMQAHISVENITTDALRGVIAATDVEEGDSLALLPDDLIIEMGSQRHSSAVSRYL